MLYQLAYSQRAILIVLLAFPSDSPFDSTKEKKKKKKVAMNELG